MSGIAAVLGHVTPIMTQTTPPRIRFGEFEADLEERKLYRNDQLVDLQSKGFNFLAVLLTRPGQTVTRTEIARELWHGIHVQVDQGLNAAVRKVRRALGDDAYEPVYVQTVGSIGYRFIHPVEVVDDEEEMTGTDD